MRARPLFRIPLFRILPAVAMAATLCGCGDGGPRKVRLGDAPAGRRAEFAEAVARSCAGFEGLDGATVKFGISTNGPAFAVTVSCAEMDKRELQGALSVAVTNLAIEYPGLGFMLDDDGVWKILMPDDVAIPVSGAFGIGGK